MAATVDVMRHFHPTAKAGTGPLDGRTRRNQREYQKDGHYRSVRHANREERKVVSSRVRSPDLRLDAW